MKRLLILVVIAILAIQANAQKLQANWNIANYVDYDSTTFILGAAKDVEWITIDFPLVSSNDIIMFVGIPDADGQGVRNIDWEGSTVSPDSVILNKTTYTKKIRKSDGTRYSTTRVSLWWMEGLPEDYVALTFVWGTAATGRIKVYYGD